MVIEVQIQSTQVTLSGDVPRTVIAFAASAAIDGELWPCPAGTTVDNSGLAGPRLLSRAGVAWLPAEQRLAFEANGPPERWAELPSWLFEVLGGGAAWDLIMQAREGIAVADPARAGLIVLEISATGALRDLPWELARGKDGPLVASITPRVALVRKLALSPAIAAAPPAVRPLRRPLKVLFVVGSAPGDREIAAGAEILGAMRSQDRLDEELRVRSRVLLKASRSSLADAMRSFRPEVVHLICHGKANAVVLRTPDDKAQEDVTAGQLLSDLRGGDGALELPSVVVLNACNSGVFSAGNVSVGAVLVEGGVPLVVAMNGKIADVVCRQFTRVLYAAMLDGKDALEAVTRARANAGNPNVVVEDWARVILLRGRPLPTASVAGAVPGEVGATITAQGISLLKGVANLLGLPDAYRIFADHAAISARWEEMLALPLDQAGGHAVLALEAPARLSTQPPYGKTALVWELAVRALRSGHVPLVVDLVKLSSKEIQGLLSEILQLLVLVEGHLGTTPDTAEQSAVKAAIAAEIGRRTEVLNPMGGTANALPQRVAFEVHLRHQLVAAQARLRERRKDDLPGARLVVLIDSLEDGDKAGEAILEMLRFSRQDGFGLPGQRVLAVVAMDLSLPDNAGLCKRWTDEVGTNAAGIHRVALRGWPEEGTGDDLPGFLDVVREHLLAIRSVGASPVPGLTWDSANDTVVELAASVGCGDERAPGGLGSPNFKSFLTRAMAKQVLRPASDDEALIKMALNNNG